MRIALRCFCLNFTFSVLLKNSFHAQKDPEKQPETLYAKYFSQNLAVANMVAKETIMLPVGVLSAWHPRVNFALHPCLQ